MRKRFVSCTVVWRSMLAYAYTFYPIFSCSPVPYFNTTPPSSVPALYPLTIYAFTTKFTNASASISSRIRNVYHSYRAYYNTTMLLYLRLDSFAPSAVSLVLRFEPHSYFVRGPSSLYTTYTIYLVSKQLTSQSARNSSHPTSTHTHMYSLCFGILHINR